MRAGTWACSSRARPPSCCHLCGGAGACIELASSRHDFAPVPTDEMAFALSLFVETANRRISSAASFSCESNDASAEVCKHLYGALSAEIEGLPIRAHPRTESQTTLYSAFCSLCMSYDGDPLQVAVCARVLAFHLLMERTAGAVLGEWIQAHPDSVEVVTLHPAVVEAIAKMRLHGRILIAEGAFLEQVIEEAKRSSPGSL